MGRIALAKHLWRKFCNYMRHDFKEIVFPSSLPDPPGRKKSRKLTWDDHVLLWKVACRLYIKSFKTPDLDIDEEIESVKNPDKVKTKKVKEEKKDEPKEPSTLEDLAVAAKAGSEHIRPALHRIYMTKVSAYKDAVKNFVEGYQEGLKEVLDSDHTTEPRSNNTVSDSVVGSPDTDAKETEPVPRSNSTARDTELGSPDIKAKEMKSNAKVK